MNTDKETILAELELILDSACFRSRKQMRNFLQYVVVETLEGRSRYLKQYTIAVGGLEKPEDFSPSENPLVRVEAGRLRRLLEQYYREEGADRPLRIKLPKGTYRPEFESQEEAVKRHSGVGVATASPEVGTYTQNVNVLLGFKCFTQTPELLDTHYRIARDFSAVASKFPFINILSASPNNSVQLSGHDYLSHIRDRYQADYFLKIDLEMLNQTVSLKCMVLHTATEKLIWTEHFELQASPSSHELDRIYGRIANAVFSLDQGAALKHWSMRQMDPPSKIFAQQTLPKLVRGFKVVSPEQLSEYINHCQLAHESNTHDTDALIALLYFHLIDFVMRTKIVDAFTANFVKLARLARHQDPSGPETTLFAAMANYLQMDAAGSKELIAHALELNPYSALNHYIAAVLSYLINDYQTADKALNTAVSLSSDTPDWYFVMTCLSAYRRGNYAEALQEAKKVYTDWGNFLQAICAHKMNNPQYAERALGALESDRFEFPAGGSQDSLADLFLHNPILSTIKNEVMPELRSSFGPRSL